MTTTELTWQGIPTHTRKKRKNIPLLSPLEAVECKVMFQNEHTFFIANCENGSVISKLHKVTDSKFSQESIKTVLHKIARLF